MYMYHEISKDCLYTSPSVNVSTFTYESGPGDYDDFPHTEEPVYILGEIYSAEYGESTDG